MMLAVRCILNARRTASITSMYPPHPHLKVFCSWTSSDSPTSVVNVSSGEDFTLSCPVTKGSHVTWYKLTSSRSVKLEAVSGAGQQLTLSGVTQPDSGRYMCEGKGNQGGIEHTQRHYFYLKVTSGKWLLMNDYLQMKFKRKTYDIW